MFKKVGIVIVLMVFVVFVCVVLGYFRNTQTIKNTFTNTHNNSTNHEGNKIACLYAYFEKNDQYKNNFITFLNTGILDHVDYFIIINGDCTVDIEERDNIHVVRRDNEGFDFGAWGHVVKQYDISRYDYIIFLNTSVVGPFYHGEDWTEPFVKLIDKDTKLVGTSINVCKDVCYDDHQNTWPNTMVSQKKKVIPHVQSMCFAIDKEALDFLIDMRFFDIDENISFLEVIGRNEIGMSTLILENGWNITSLLEKYRGHDYRTLEEDINATSHDGDPYFHGAYFGEDIKPSEVIFFKSSRMPETQLPLKK
jgi:hypothetical protein